MATYGRITQGASWDSFELGYRGRKITLASGETATKISAYMRSVGSATNGIRAALYNYADNSFAYQSSVMSGFTDTTGAWRDFVFTDSVAAGDYWLVIIADAIAGGGNTIEVASDTVSADATLYEGWFYGGGGWPTLDADLDGLEIPYNTQDISVYLETSAGGGGGGNSIAWITA